MVLSCAALLLSLVPAAAAGEGPLGNYSKAVEALQDLNREPERVCRDPSPRVVRRSWGWTLEGLPRLSDCTAEVRSELRERAPDGRLPATVASVIDGDTVHIMVGGRKLRVRFLSIDAPETHYMGRSQEPWGSAATRRLLELIPPGTPVTVRINYENPCDVYNRLLGTVEHEGVNINRRLVEESLAFPSCYFPEPESSCDRFARASRQGRSKGTGIWGAYASGSLLDPAEFRARIRRERNGTAPYKYIGNRHTREIFAPGSYSRVPVQDRIYFMKQADIPSGYSRR